MTTAKAALPLLTLALAACAIPDPRPVKIDDRIAAELNAAAETRKAPAAGAQVYESLLPPLKLELPKPSARPIEPRFDLSVNNAPASQVFTSIASGTRYSMLVHQEITGNVTVNLKDVTMQEALDALRELYGYEYRIDGTRIFVRPQAIQLRVFRINYLVGQRLGRSDIRVTSGSVADAPPSTGIGGIAGIGLGGVPGVAAQPATPLTGTTGPAGPTLSPVVTDSSRIQTTVRSDFWDELRRTLNQIVGEEGGRGVVINSQASLIVVRAMPAELREVESYLRALRLSIERQVMLEAKIVEVTLSNEFQAGINWALFANSGRSAAGLLNPTTRLGTAPANAALGSAGVNTTGNLTVNSQPGSTSMATGTAGALISGLPGGSLFGLAFATKNFAALLTFLESQGTVQVLSSPRIATLNNQKAILKVGTDEFFLTNIAGGTTNTAVGLTGATNTFPTLTLRPFFSGVALDVTPQVDEDSSIILHVHPSVSNVQQDDRVVNLGAVFGGAISLPLARSSVSETDSIVRVLDGNIVAIGGLMKLDRVDARSGLPGLQGDASSFNPLFGSPRRTEVKKELVILIKPTVIQTEADSAAEVREARDRVLNLGGGGASR